MISLIFRVKAKPGKEEEAVAKMTAMAESVKANEPGALTYSVHRLQEDPSVIVLWEAYKDDDAFKTHQGTAHMNDMRGAFAELFDTSTVKLERLDRAGGFIRGD
jgi:quinol monooxygenase YgiN